MRVGCCSPGDRGTPAGRAQPRGERGIPEQGGSAAAPEGRWGKEGNEHWGAPALHRVKSSRECEAEGQPKILTPGSPQQQDCPTRGVPHIPGRCWHCPRPGAPSPALPEGTGCSHPAQLPLPNLSPPLPPFRQPSAFTSPPLRCFNPLIHPHTSPFPLLLFLRLDFFIISALMH